MLFYDSLDEFRKEELSKLENLPQANLPEWGVIARVMLPDAQLARESDKQRYSITGEVQQLSIDFQGIVGERHRCLHRPSNGREKSLYPPGTEIRQSRHLFAVSSGDCKTLSNKLGVEITPELLGANLLVARDDGADFSLSQLPTGTHLVVAPEDAEKMPQPPIATLIHYVKQQGCVLTGGAIASTYDRSELKKQFVLTSRDYRGILCSVEYPVTEVASLAAGQRIYFKYPKGIVP